MLPAIHHHLREQGFTANLMPHWEGYEDLWIIKIAKPSPPFGTINLSITNNTITLIYEHSPRLIIATLDINHPNSINDIINILDTRGYRIKEKWTLPHHRDNNE